MKRTDQSDLFDYSAKHDSEEQVVQPADHLKIEDPGAPVVRTAGPRRLTDKQVQVGFGPPTDAQQAADKAIDRATFNANQAWTDEAFVTACSMAMGQATFTARDIRAAMPEDVDTHEHRAMGGVMRRLQAEGIIAATKNYKASGDLVNHNGPVRVWRSLLFSGRPADAGRTTGPSDVR